MNRIGKLLLLSAGAAAAAGALRVSTSRNQSRKDSRIPLKEGICLASRPLIGGVHQYVQLRGQDRTNPVLLYVHGGPGEAMSAVSHSYQKEWESFFTVALYDQRGCGLSERSRGSLHMDDFVMDLREIADYIHMVLPGVPIVLFGQSWGTVIGAQAALRYPDAFAAYIGTGQVVDVTRTFAEAYRHAEECAAEEHNEKLQQALKQAEQKGDGRFFSSAYAMAKARYGFTSMRYRTAPQLLKLITSAAVTCPDLSLPEALKSGLGGLAMSRQYRDFIQSEEFIKFRLDHLGSAYRISFFLIEGDHDWQTPYPLAREYYEKIEAPDRQWYTLEGSGHMVQFDNLPQLTETLRRIHDHLFGDDPQA